ncbi:MAG: hypothetical protein H0W96_10080, partial [Solirubrobacterales bacterium]|nr:hypothetical protein [Solirubrobacterales bacterium]
MRSRKRHAGRSAGPPAQATVFDPVARRNSRLALAVAFGLATLVMGGGQAVGQAPSAAAIVAGDNVFRTIDGGNPNVTIAAGGHVDFSYASGSSQHNVHFTGLKPSVCEISKGPTGNQSALPVNPSPPIWEGGCDFTVAGSYRFVCDLHGSMTGSVTVLA